MEKFSKNLKNLLSTCKGNSLSNKNQGIFLEEKGAVAVAIMLVVMLMLTAIVLVGCSNEEGKAPVPVVSGDNNEEGKTPEPVVSGDNNEEGKTPVPVVSGDNSEEDKTPAPVVSGDNSEEDKTPAPEVIGESVVSKLKVGDYVNYKPDGIYKGVVGDASLEWRVWRIEGNNVIITPKVTVSSWENLKLFWYDSDVGVNKACKLWYTNNNLRNNCRKYKEYDDGRCR